MASVNTVHGGRRNLNTVNLNKVHSRKIKELFVLLFTAMCLCVLIPYFIKRLTDAEHFSNNVKIVKSFVSNLDGILRKVNRVAQSLKNTPNCNLFFIYERST